jgi:lysozyme family protein
MPTPHDLTPLKKYSDLAFRDCLRWVLEMEGVNLHDNTKTGFVNDPHDPGGITNWGISYRFLKGVRPNATPEEIINMTLEQAAYYYHEFFWKPLACDIMDISLALVVFDTGVNMGVDRATRMLQKVLGVAVDGKIGPNTRKAIVTMSTTKLLYMISVLNNFTVKRLKKYTELNGFDRYKNSWFTRTVATHSFALDLYLEARSNLT